MAAIGDLIIVCVVGSVLVAARSLMIMGARGMPSVPSLNRTAADLTPLIAPSRRASHELAKIYLSDGSQLLQLRTVRSRGD